jgi:hypothetical protein
MYVGFVFHNISLSKLPWVIRNYISKISIPALAKLGLKALVKYIILVRNIKDRTLKMSSSLHQETDHLVEKTVHLVDLNT